MNISDLLVPGAVIPALKAQNKKQLLQELASRSAPLTQLPEKRIFDPEALPSAHQAPK